MLIPVIITHTDSLNQISSWITYFETLVFTHDLIHIYIHGVGFNSSVEGTLHSAVCTNTLKTYGFPKILATD